MSSVYWHAAYAGKLSTLDCVQITSNFQAGGKFDTLSATQAQYGVFYYYWENTVASSIMPNLLSNTQYSYVLCPTNQLGIIGTATNGTFTTSDNGAQIYEVVISFKAKVTQAALPAIACLFMNYFQLPNLNVVFMDGTTCQSATYIDDNSTYNYQAISLFVYGDRRTDTPSTLYTALSDAINELAVQTVSTFTGTFTEALRSGNVLINYISTTLNSATQQAEPVLDDSKIQTSSDGKSLTISGFSLTSGNGYVYAIASLGGINPPTYNLVRAKQNATKFTVPGANVRYTGTPVSLKIKGLAQNTSYNVYYYASNEDLSQYGKVTDVKYVIAQTGLISATVSAANLVVNIILLLSVILFMIA